MNDSSGTPDALAKLSHELAEALDTISRNSGNAFSAGQLIDQIRADWEQRGGSQDGAALAAQARGVAGMIAASAGDDRMKDHAYRELTALKNSLRNRARGSS
jgi:hypothetical protein